MAKLSDSFFKLEVYVNCEKQFTRNDDRCFLQTSKCEKHFNPKFKKLGHQNLSFELLFPEKFNELNQHENFNCHHEGKMVDEKKLMGI